jgi:hypothetical protein
MSLGTNINEAFHFDNINNEEEHHNSLQNQNSIFYNPIENTEMSNSKVGSTIISDLQPNSEEHMQKQQMSHVQQMPQMPQMQPLQQIQQPLQSINPVREYPTYEYDANAFQAQLHAQNLEKKLQDLKHLKNIKQNRHKTEHFEEGKKGGIMKSLIFSFLILLAISIHFFIAFVYEHFVTATGQFSLRQEIGLRLIYPTLIFIFVWWVKTQ